MCFQRNPLLIRAAVILPLIFGAACHRAEERRASPDSVGLGGTGDAKEAPARFDLAPRVELGPTRYANQEIFLDVQSSDAVKWQWEQLAGPGTITFSSPDTEDTSVTANRDGFYWLRLTVTGSDGTESFDDVQLLWDTVSPCPVLPNELRAFRPTLLDGKVPSDAVSIQWKQLSGPGLIAFSDASKNPSTISADIDGTYGIRLTAVDRVGNACSADMSFIWQTTVPSVAVGPDLYTNKEIAIDAASVEASSFSWSQVSGPGTISFSAANQEDTKVTANADGDYVLRLTITTMSGLIAFDELVLHWDTTAPTVSLGPDMRKRYRAIIDAQTSGAETFVWKKVSGPGKITFASEDTEDTVFISDRAGTYVISLTASDLAGNTAIDTISVQFDYDARAFAKEISSGGSHSCAIMDDDTVSCWGYNYSQELGYGDENKFGEGIDRYMPPSFPIKLGAGRTARHISANYSHTCAVLDDGNVKCWGQNASGQLGYGDTKKLGMPAALPVNLGGVKAKTIATGLAHTCVILENDTMKCWGANSAGQLGYGDYTNRLAPPALSLNLGLNRLAKSMSLGAYHSCAILDDNSLKCWGNNNNGQLGLTDKNYRNSPDLAVSFPANAKVRSITTGAYHTCAILDNSNTHCWGRGKQGQLGYGDIADKLVADSAPVIFNGPKIKSLSAGLSHTCALYDDSSVRCWGGNETYQLGTGDYVSQFTATLASSIDFGGAAVKSLSSGRLHNCVILDDATLKCWGSNSYGQLGAGRSFSDGTPPPNVISFGD